MTRAWFWAESEDAANYVTGEGGKDAPDGDFVVVQELDGDTKLLEWDDTAEAFVVRGDVDLDGNDLDDVGEVEIAGLVEFGPGDFKLESEDVAGVTRLLLRAFSGGDEAAELALVPLGGATDSRLLLTDDPNLSNFEGIEVTANDTEMVVESVEEGTGSVLPLRLKVDGSTAIDLATDASVTVEQLLALEEPMTLEDAAEPSTPSGDDVAVWNDTNELKAKFSDGSVATLAQE